MSVLLFCFEQAMAIPLHLFKTGWSFNEETSETGQISHVYPVGMDYVRVAACSVFCWDRNLSFDSFVLRRGITLIMN